MSASSDKTIMNEIQLILAEKRTALSTMRTGIAVSALPLTVFSFLIATKKLYDVENVLEFFVPLVMITTSLVFLGAYLVARSFFKIHRYDKMITNIKKNHSKLAEFID